MGAWSVVRPALATTLVATRARPGSGVLQQLALLDPTVLDTEKLSLLLWGSLPVVWKAKRMCIMQLNHYSINYRSLPINRGRGVEVS